jgi:hypothetical protein
MGLKVVRIDEEREQAYQEYVAGYDFAKHARSKNKQVSSLEEHQMSPSFRKGYRRGLNENAVMEGPIDFMRGMGGAVAQKAARPVQAIKRGVQDVVQAGRTASATGDFTKLVQQFAQLLVQRHRLKGMIPQQPTEPDQAPQAAAPAPQQTKPQSAAPEAFRTTSKTARFVPGKHGPEYTFNSFIQDMSGEQINEGMWDFVKGAGGAIADKARQKIDSYAQKNRGWLNDVVDASRDIIQTGRGASAAGDLKKAMAQLEQVNTQALALKKQLLDMMRQFGDNATNILGQAVSTLPRNQRDHVYALLTTKS